MAFRAVAIPVDKDVAYPKPSANSPEGFCLLFFFILTFSDKKAIFLMQRLDKMKYLFRRYHSLIGLLAQALPRGVPRKTLLGQDTNRGQPCFSLTIFVLTL